MKQYSTMAASLFCLSALCDIAFADEVTDLISRSEASGAKSANEASGLIDGFTKYAAQQSGLSGKKVDSLNSEDKSRNGLGITHNQELTPFDSKLPPSASARKFPKQEALNLPHQGKGTCKDKGLQGSGKCPSSLFESLEAKQGSGTSSGVKLLVFVSQSVPADSIKELWNQAQRVGAKLLFRGLVGGSFKETQNYIQELGIVADIDPVKFDDFEISQVPAFILSKGDKHDKMVGNVSLSAFLEQSSASGSLQKEAGELYQKLQGEQP